MVTERLILAVPYVRSLLKRRETALFLYLAAFILFATPVRAQLLYGSLTGNVADTSGAAIPQATVVLLEMSKGITQEATTDGSGVYRFSELLPGDYKVTISAKGFNSSVVEGVNVNVNSVQRIDAKLPVATVTEAITVSSAPPELQTDRSDVHTDLSTSELQSLPAISSEGKSFQSLYRIVPGAGLPTENNSAAGNPARAMTANVNGQSSQGNSTKIDGVGDAYPWLPNNIAYVPPTDAIETVNIATNSFDAEQGMVNGAAVSVQIKTGTNKFHGDAHEFHTDNNLRARNYFTPANYTNPHNIFNQFGGAVGGPIRKDKLFFFGDWESTRQVQAPSGGNPQTVPAGGLLYGNASQAGFFDFRGLMTDSAGNPLHIYDPRTGAANGSGRSPISCNGVVDTICLTDVDPAAKTMASLIPGPNQTGATNNYFVLQKGFFHRDNYDGKVNYVPNQKSMIFGRFTYSNGDIFDPPALGPAGGNATLGGQQGNAFTRIYIIGLGGTYAFGPRLLLDTNGGFTRQHLTAENIDVSQNKAYGLDTLKIPGTNDPTNQLYWGIPAFQFVNFSNLGNPSTGNPFVFRDNQYVANVNLTWIRGNHQFRFGFEYDHTQLNHFQPQGGSFQTARGSFRFTGAATESVTCAPAGVQPPGTAVSCSGHAPTQGLQYNSYADFLLGLPDEVGKAVQNVNPIALRWTQTAAYARDQWQVTPKLSVDLGVRWEFYPMAYSDHGGARVLDPNTMNVLIGGSGGVPLKDGVSVGAGLFLPRIGIAYRPTNTTVFRLGYGIGADSNNWRFLRNSYPAVTISDFVSNTYPQALKSAFAPAASFTGQNATGSLSYLPTGITLIPVVAASGSIPFPNNVGTTTIPRDFRRGYIHGFNATLEQKLAGFVWNVGYVGTRGIRVLTNLNINPAPGGGGQTGRLLNAKFGGTWSDINQLTPLTNNYYDSLQTQITRRLGAASQVGAVYTWSKAIDLEDNEEINFILWPYPAYFSKNRALAGFDRTNNFELYGVYDLPFGKGKRWASGGIANLFAGGWQVAGVLSALSGTPFTVTDSNGGTFNAPGNTQVPNLVGAVHVVNGKPRNLPATCAAGDLSCHYLDPSNFAHVTSPGVLGNAGRDIVRGPGYFDLDLNVFRTFKITERMSFQFEADGFGITNTPHFGNPTADINNSNFGKNTGALQTVNAGLGGSGGERQWWFGGKFVF